MKRFVFLSVMVALVLVGTCWCRSAAANTITIKMVTVGDAGNAADTHGAGYGAVANEFLIGMYEVSNAEYAAFLNAAAKTDPYGLYNASMGSDGRAGISQSGSSGSYTYSVKTGTGYTMADKPVIHVSFYDTLRFCNWLHNGQPNDGSGLQSGAYTLLGTGATPTSPATITRSTDAKYWLPTEDEWYKAAYYKGGGTDAGYWDYATQSDTKPTAVGATAAGVGRNLADGTTPVTLGNYANFNKIADWNGEDGNVTTVGTNGGPSAYGAFDFDGNVKEWHETLTETTGATKRGVAQGTWSAAAPGKAGLRGSDSPANEYDSNVGFRVASIIFTTSLEAILAAVPTSGSTIILGTDLALLTESTLTDAISLTNTGDPGSTLDVTGCSITGANPSLFAVPDWATAVLTAGGSSNVKYDVTFNGSPVQGDYSALLTFNTSKGDVSYDLRASAIPEPGTLALLACGLLGLGFYAWRRRRS